VQDLCLFSLTDQLEETALHRGQRYQLQQVVRHHVAQRAGLFIVSAALFDADLLAGVICTLSMYGDPNRLEDTLRNERPKCFGRFLAR